MSRQLNHDVSAQWWAFTTRWQYWSRMKSCLFWFLTLNFFSKQNATAFIRDQHCHLADDGSPLCSNSQITYQLSQASFIISVSMPLLVGEREICYESLKILLLCNRQVLGPFLVLTIGPDCWRKYFSVIHCGHCSLPYVSMKLVANCLSSWDLSSNPFKLDTKVHKNKVWSRL